MLRISILDSESGRKLLKLEGKIIGTDVDELRRSCEPLLATRTRFSLDLNDVSYIDHHGVLLMRELFARDVTVSRTSAFVMEQLKGVGQC